MYDQFYALQGRPFQLTPDPHFYFESATHRKALSYLGYGLAQGEGFIVITGDIGAGKTTLVGHLMATIDPARLTAVKIVSTQVEGDDMLRLAAQSFGLPADGAPKAQLLQRVEAFLHAQARAGRRSLLIVDEAQNLPVSAIEELRMLSNFQLGGQSLLQIFLLGQPEFRDLLKSSELEQLRQRVIATHHLDPMMASEIEPYIIHRLSLVGWNGNPQLTAPAFAALYKATGGVPRRINALVSRVLLMGAIERLGVIDADVVEAVAAEMNGDSDARPEAAFASPLDTFVEEPVAEEYVPIAEEPAIEEAAPDGAIFAETGLEEWGFEDAGCEETAIEEWGVGASDIEDSPVEETAIAADAILADDIVSNPIAATSEEEVGVTEEEEAVAYTAPSIAHHLLIPQDDEIAALRAEIADLRTRISEPVVPAAPNIDPEALKDCLTIIDERLNGIETRALEQDVALRRVLALLVDWVEQEDRMLDPQQDVA